MEIFKAKCSANGVVSILRDSEWLVSEDTMILSAGRSESSGFVLVGSNASLYITSTIGDTERVIDGVSDIVSKVLAFNFAGYNIGAGDTSAPDPAAAQQITDLQESKSSFDAIKGELL